MIALGQASEDRVPWVRTVRADSDVLKERALRLPNRVPSQTVHNLCMCTWSLYSYVLQAGYELDGCCSATGPGGASGRLKEDVRTEAKSMQMPLQTSRHATKAMAQQVPMKSSDILSD